MIIKHITRNLKDIFIGEGWDNWARIDLGQNKVVATTLSMHKAFEHKLVQQCRQYLSHRKV